MLGFDCGGQQWVLEVAFPTGTLKYALHSSVFPLLCPELEVFCTFLVDFWLHSVLNQSVM